MEEVEQSMRRRSRMAGKPPDSVFVDANAVASNRWMILGYRVATVVGVLAVLWVATAWTRQLTLALKKPLTFDDAFMFWRYAVNLRHGLGMSWNLDGAPTYGETAILWGVVVLALSYLPMSAGTALVVGSWSCSVLAAAGLGWAVRHNAKSLFMASVWRVVPVIAFSLDRNRLYLQNALTGMETMLGVVFVAVFVGLAVAWQRRAVRSVWLGLAGFAVFLVRPEALIVVLSLPVLLYFLMPPIPRRQVGIVVGVVALCLLADLAVCKLYFHSALPLSFYIKSVHNYYEGYAGNWTPVGSAWAFLSSFKLYLVCLVLVAGKGEWRLAVCCLIPAIATFAYLMTTLQIMGDSARYYMPYLSLLVVPAFLGVDAWIKRFEGRWNQWEWRWNARFALQFVVAVALGLVLRSSWMVPVVRWGDKRVAGSIMVYDPVKVTIAATIPLKATYRRSVIQEMGDRMLAPLPAGTTVATSEVGYVGVAAPQMNVIDLAGLNDTEIAMHGFNADNLIARKPDIIWLPHLDYTYQRAQIMMDPKLLEQYDLYADADVFGIAIRKDSPNRKQLMRQMNVLWDDLYDGQPMDQYKVHSVSWSGRKHPPEDFGAE